MINKVIKINLYIFIILIPLFFFYTSIQATISPCNEYTQVQPVPTGFGAAYDVDNPTDLLIKGSCDDTGNSATFTIGDGSSDTYIYNKGYFYRSGAWQEININPNGAISGNWLIGSAQTTINLNTSELDVNNHIVAYTCKRQVDNSWKCGCADSACTNKYWQVQRFKIDSTPPPPVTCSDGTPLNTCSISQPDPYYCNNSGNIVEDCGECGCSNNWNCESDGTCTDPNICIPTLVCTDYPGQCGTGMSDGCDNILDCSTNCSGLEICCNDNCQTTACSNSSACDDFDNCTTDTCQNAGTCTAVCQNTTITTCADGDGCCPSGCDSGNDDDCSSLNVNITAPTDNAYFKIDDWLGFDGSAIGGKAPYTFKWSSDKDGYLGEGQWFSYRIPTAANLGEHIMILEVEDADGIKSTDTITININSANTLTANLDFWKYEFTNGELWDWKVIISGGTDPYSVNWTSDLMGDISNEQWVNIDSTATPWNVGEHLIQAVVQDAIGDTVTLSTVIKITDVSLEMWPKNASNFYFGNNIWFDANVIGATGIYDYIWTSNKDGLLRDSGDKPENFDLFQSSSLSEGIHNIELEVTYDTNKTISKNIQIQINPIDPSLVDCFDFSGCNDSDPCTDDVCNKPGLMTSYCSNDLKTICQDNDICCPVGCNSTNDNDCTLSADNDDPAKVLVIYNDRCSRDNNENGINDNKELALYYQQKRNIPEENMLPVYPSVGGSGCNHYYWQVDSYPDFYNDIVLTIKNKLSQLGENNVYYFNLIGVPTSITVNTIENTGRSLDQALATLNDIDDATNYYNYWDYCNAFEYCEVYYGSTLTKPRFDHSFKYNGDNMYLVTRVHKMNLIDGALYGEKYIYNEDGYYRGRGYVDTRFNEYTDIYLNDNYPTFNDATSYGKGDRKMAYGKRIFEIENWDFKWEVTEKEIGESGAVFTDGSNAEFVNDAMWYEGWYNFGKYLDVWQWKAGSVACDLNSNSGKKFLQGAFNKGLTAGVGVTGEPYLTGHPEPEVFIHYMLNGYNFAESAILSYPGWKWRDISYGDPLYNPNKVGKIKVKDTIAPSIMQIFHKINTSNTSSSSYITVRLDMNSAVPDVATYKLEYGVNISYGNVFDYDEIYTIEKEFMLDDLVANTTYHYRIIAKDPVGNISVSSDNIFKTSVDDTVLPDSIKATASVNIGNAPLSVDFNSTFGSAPVSFIWNFADGSTSLDPNPNHIFSKGFYKVVLQAEFSNGLSVNKELLIIVK
ncbi:MAG: TIGR03790 family protein [Patescibacteria group bacterium]|nr:TIGR03790 family protein [Patescibacteria group bacterium]